MITIHQRHRRTDRRTDVQTTCDRNTALCTKVHRAVKITDINASEQGEGKEGYFSQPKAEIRKAKVAGWVKLPDPPTPLRVNEHPESFSEKTMTFRTDMVDTTLTARNLSILAASISLLFQR